MACHKCGKPLVKADRGNIALGNPDGFDHIDCAKSQYLGRDMSVPDRVHNDELIAPPAPKDPKEGVPECDAAKDDSAPVMEQKEEKAEYTKPIKKGGQDSIFKKRLS